MERFIQLVLFAVSITAFFSSIASAACGSRGGPGIRGANGKCLSWSQAYGIPRPGSGSTYRSRPLYNPPTSNSESYAARPTIPYSGGPPGTQKQMPIQPALPSIQRPTILSSPRPLTYDDCHRTL